MDKSETIREKMLGSPMGVLLIKISFPTVVIELISVIYNTADTFFVSKISATAAAAVGIVFSIMSLIQAVSYGVGMGTGALVSRALGMQKNERADAYAVSGVVLGVLFGMLLMTGGLSALNGLLRLIGASETVLPFARIYGMFILISAPFMSLAFVLSRILTAEGKTVFPMIGLICGGIMNIVLDPLFIFSFHMGIAGAALATMLSQIISSVIMLFFFLSRRSIVQLKIRSTSKEITDYVLIIKTGLPTIFRQSLGALASSILNVQVVVYGDAAVAAMAIANKVYLLVRHIVLGIGHGYQAIAGYCYGARRYDRVRKVVWMTILYGTVICLAIAVLTVSMPSAVIRFFVNDPKVLEIGSHTLRWFALAMPLMAFSTYVNQLYQCLGFTVPATLLACCRQGFFFVPLAFILPDMFGIGGIEMLQSIADILTFIISVPALMLFFRRHLAVGELPSA